MPSPSVPAAAALLLAAVPGASAANLGGVQVAQLMFQQQVVVRMQRSVPVKPAVRPPLWREKKGPKCVPVDDLAGALVTQPNSVDLVLKGGERFRARLEDDCPALDFYNGFYLRPAKDGKVCAGRDTIRYRSGRTCEIDKFRRLVTDK